MTENKQEKLAARELAKAQGIKYTEALRIVRQTKEKK